MSGRVTGLPESPRKRKSIRQRMNRVGDESWPRCRSPGVTGSMEERRHCKKLEFAKSSLEERREGEELGERAQTFQTGPPK